MTNADALKMNNILLGAIFSIGSVMGGSIMLTQVKINDSLAKLVTTQAVTTITVQNNKDRSKGNTYKINKYHQLQVVSDETD